MVSTAQKVSPTSLLPAQSVAVSASADVHSSRVSPSTSVIGHEPVSLSLRLSVTRCSFRWLRLLSSDPVAVLAHTLFSRGGGFFSRSVLLMECAFGGVSFFWRGWSTLPLTWLEELQLEVCIGPTRLLRGRTDHLGSRLHIRYDNVLCTAFGSTISRR